VGKKRIVSLDIDADADEDEKESTVLTPSSMYLPASISGIVAS
jgi:hypothetical protein